MPITESFDPDSPEIIAPAPVAGGPVPSTLIVTFQPHTFAVLLDRYDTRLRAMLALEEPVADPHPLAPGALRTFSADGRELAALLSPIGAPTTVALLEEAVASGVTKVVSFGTCGGLVPGLGSGGVIVPTAAYRDEGTSYHYAPPSDFIEIATWEKTAAILTGLGVAHTPGAVWTTDAFYRETRNNLAKRVAAGCVAVDMVVAAVAAWAAYRGVAAHQFLFTADSLSDVGWDRGTLGRLPSEPRARLLSIAIDVALRI